MHVLLLSENVKLFYRGLPALLYWLYIGDITGYLHCFTGYILETLLVSQWSHLYWLYIGDITGFTMEPSLLAIYWRHYWFHNGAIFTGYILETLLVSQWSHLNKDNLQSVATMYLYLEIEEKITPCTICTRPWILSKHGF